MIEKNILLDGKTILITGCAGFIGAALVELLLQTIKDINIIGVDDLNDYYDVSLKEYRLNQIKKQLRRVSASFTFVKGNIADRIFVNSIFEKYKIEIIVNLAAQAGVRYSIDKPYTYIESNIIGFYNILEACRRNEMLHLIYASSSSVYGNNKKTPYSTEDRTDKPVSLYAATKKMDELLAYSYAKLYGIPMTGLRFFTVYGPAGRPDMAYFTFTKKLVYREKIKIFNYGKCMRDFTYIDDITMGIKLVMHSCPLINEEGVRYKIYNIGNGNPVNLIDFVNTLEKELKQVGVLPESFDIESYMDLVKMQPGDVEITYADVLPLENDFGFKPLTTLQEGLKKFAEWYYLYYKIETGKNIVTEI